jgi:hypothetical protein
MKEETPAGFSNVFQFAWLLAGSALISVSSGIGLVRSFNGDFVSVYFCLLGFISGYKIAQIGIYNGRKSGNIFTEYFRRIKTYGKIDALSLFGGSIFMTIGYVVLTRGIIEASVVDTVVSAIVMGAGYILVHWAINNTLV